MRHLWRRCGSALLLAIGLAGLTAVPAAAKDTYAFFGPLEIRIFGANGDLRDFIALSAKDRRGATALVNEIAGAMQGPAQPMDAAAPALPHYRIGVSHLGLTYVTSPWARTSETSFIYYPGDAGSGYLIVEFSQGDAALQERWMQLSPEVAALLQGHLQGLSPIGIEPAASSAATEPWGIAIGAILLAALSLMLVEDRRRWRLSEEGRSAGKGTDRRS